MDDIGDIVGLLFAGIVAVGIIAFFVITPFVRFDYVTSTGQHTGYVTAIEHSGVFFKTWRAYVKTDTQSSQEDTYCVLNDATISILQHDVETKQHVTLDYVSWLHPSVSDCKGAEAIITGVTDVPN